MKAHAPHVPNGPKGSGIPDPGNHWRKAPSPKGVLARGVKLFFLHHEIAAAGLAA